MTEIKVITTEVGMNNSAITIGEGSDGGAGGVSIGVGAGTRSSTTLGAGALDVQAASNGIFIGNSGDYSGFGAANTDYVVFKAGGAEKVLTAAQFNAMLEFAKTSTAVPTTTTVNSKALSSNIVLDGSDIQATVGSSTGTVNAQFSALKTSIDNMQLQDGSEAHPYLISSVSDLEQLRQDVASGDCKEGKYFLQTKDIDMSDLKDSNDDVVLWAGIGLKNGDDPDSSACFKGVYNGGYHTIYNLRFTYVENGDNELYGFFRSVMNATIKNLTINVDQTVTGSSFGGAAFVGTVKDGVTMVNCVANGTMGTDTNPCDHTSAGIISYVTTPTTAADHGHFIHCVTLINVTNNVNVFSTRKVGGIIGFLVHDLILDNVVNNGMVVRTIGKSSKTDAVGGIIGYAGTNPHPCYKWKGVANTGHVEVDPEANSATITATGQLVGLFAAESASNTNLGDVKMQLNDLSLSISKTATFTGIGGLGLWFGQMKADGFCHVVHKLVANGKYVYLFGATSAASYALDLPSGSSITVDCRFGKPNFTNATGTQVGSTDDWTYTVS